MGDDIYIPGMYDMPVDTQGITDEELKGKNKDELRAMVKRLDTANRRLQEDNLKRQADKRRKRAEASEYKRVTIIINKELWGTVRNYCYTKGITQGELIEQALRTYMVTLNTKRLKKAPERINNGGRPKE